jgi:uncharacterized membrane protein HdeD (DUF308 family)
MNENTIQTDRKIGNELRGWSIAMGSGLIVLGLITMAMASFSTFVSIVVLGVILAARGFIDAVHAVATYRESGFWWRLFTGTLSLVIGVMIISRPEITAVSLTLLISVFLITSGLYRAIAAPIEHRSSWGGVMFGGVISLVLGLMILSGWPVSGIWFIGLLIGIEILVQGIVFVSLPFAVKRTVSGNREIYAR